MAIWQSTSPLLLQFSISWINARSREDVWLFFASFIDFILVFIKMWHLIVEESIERIWIDFDWFDSTGWITRRIFLERNDARDQSYLCRYLFSFDRHVSVTSLSCDNCFSIFRDILDQNWIVNVFSITLRNTCLWKQTFFFFEKNKGFKVKNWLTTSRLSRTSFFAIFAVDSCKNM